MTPVRMPYFLLRVGEAGEDGVVDLPHREALLGVQDRPVADLEVADVLVRGVLGELERDAVQRVARLHERDRVAEPREVLLERRRAVDLAQRLGEARLGVGRAGGRPCPARGRGRAASRGAASRRGGRGARPWARRGWWRGRASGRASCGRGVASGKVGRRAGAGGGERGKCGSGARPCAREARSAGGQRRPLARRPAASTAQPRFVSAVRRDWSARGSRRGRGTCRRPRRRRWPAAAPRPSERAGG